jgi:hypothetical protein
MILFGVVLQLITNDLAHSIRQVYNSYLKFYKVTRFLLYCEYTSFCYFPPIPTKPKLYPCLFLLRDKPPCIIREEESALCYLLICQGIAPILVIICSNKSTAIWYGFLPAYLLNLCLQITWEGHFIFNVRYSFNAE